MLKIGYVRLDGEGREADRRALEAAGCQVVRGEAAPSERRALSAILEFIGAGDQLVVTRLDRLAGSGRGLLEALERLEARGAGLTVLEPPLDSREASGQALRAVLQAVADLEPAPPLRQRRRSPAANDIVALQRAGVGPVEIARRLGVSRMTVWRKLKTADA